MKDTELEKMAEKAARREYGSDRCDPGFYRGFKSGYKKAREWISVKERLPEVWAVYAPTDILRAVGISKASAIERAVGIRHEHYKTTEEYIAAREAEWNYLEDQGYTIKPAVLVELPSKPEGVE